MQTFLCLPQFPPLSDHGRVACSFTAWTPGLGQSNSSPFFILMVKESVSQLHRNINLCTDWGFLAVISKATYTFQLREELTALAVFCQGSVAFPCPTVKSACVQAPNDPSHGPSEVHRTYRFLITFWFLVQIWNNFMSNLIL